MSTAYYAVFHTVCENCADCLIGGTGAARSRRAWSQAYRSVEHNYVKKQCRNTETMSRFPEDIQDFARVFVELMSKRHAADYDPSAVFTKADAVNVIAQAEEAVKKFKRAPIADRRAFAAWTTMKVRPY